MSAKPKKRKKPRKSFHVRADIARGGALHIRHLTDVYGGIRCDGVELVVLAKDQPAPEWIQVAKLGAFNGHAQGQFEITRQTFQDIVRNFRATTNRRIPIDFEHASEADGSAGSIPHTGAPAQAWIIELDDRGEGGLWAKVEWLEPAKTYVETGKYKFFSPAIRFRSRDRVTGRAAGARMTSGALTNNPFLDGMRPIAASDRGGEPDTVAILCAVVAELQEQVDELTDDEDLDDEDENETADRPGDTNMAMTEIEAKALRDAETKVTELSSKANESALTLKERDAKIASQEAELKQLRDEAKAREEADRKADVDAAIRDHGAKKGISEDDRDMLMSYRLSNPAAFAAKYPKIAPAQAHLLHDQTSKGRQDPPRGAIAFGATVDDVAKQLRADDPKLDFEASFDKAVVLLRDNPVGLPIG